MDLQEYLAESRGLTEARAKGGMAGAWDIIGTSGDHDQCERCGKSNLKKCVVMQSRDHADESGEIYVGTRCAAILKGRGESSKSQAFMWKKAQEAQRDHAKASDMKTLKRITGSRFYKQLKIAAGSKGPDRSRVVTNSIDRMSRDTNMKPDEIRAYLSGRGWKGI